MALHQQKENVFLAWINGLNLVDPINRIVLLHDGVLFLKLICKLKGQEVQGLLDLPVQERFKFVSEFLQGDCRYKADEGAIVSWENILNGKNLDMELSKVIMLLMCHTISNELHVADQLDRKIELQMAAVLRFVLNNENSLHLGDNLETFLQKPFAVSASSVSNMSSFSDEESPVFKRRRPAVKFLELATVASSSVGSPIEEILKTPQFQLRKLRKQLAEERDMRDELERDLANTSQLVTDREMQISQLQHRLQRLMRDNAEQDQEPQALEELQNKNEGLLNRLHEVLRQCQDLKTNKSHMEKKIDQLTEENGNLSFKIRDAVARLSSAQKMVDTLSEEQQVSQAEWESKKLFLETELCQAVSEKESLSEQLQILQGKISILEDELRKAQAQTPEQGEVMGPIMEWERLNHEISELTCKLPQLQETILQLEKEKGEMQAKHDTEKNLFESEMSCLQRLISELQQTLGVLQGERDALEQSSREQQGTMAAQISAMNAEIARLSEMIHQKELAAKALDQQVAEEKKQSGILKEKMEKQGQINGKTIQDLSQQVERLAMDLKSKEDERAHQQAILQEVTESSIQERDTILDEYHHFRQEKEVEVLNLNQQVRQLEEQRELELPLLSDLRREKEELCLKLMSLESTVKDLQNELEVERQKHTETLAAKLQKQSLMESEIIELGNRVQQLMTEIELMGQQLNNTQQEKLHAESCMEELNIKYRDLSNTLSAERDHSRHMVTENAAKVEKLSTEVQTKTEEVEKLVKETQQYLVEIEAIRTAKINVESDLNSVIEKQQTEICTLHLELTDLQSIVVEKEAEKELLQNEISTKEEELKVKQERLLHLQSETAQMEELRENFLEEEKRHQIARQNADAGNEEARLLRITLDGKVNEIGGLLQNIRDLEEKACALQDVQNKDIEDYQHSISELEHRLADSQTQICEKAAAFEVQGEQVLSLQKDLALEQARAVSLEESLKALESALRNQKMYEKELKGEAIVHSEELKKQKEDLEKLQQEFLRLQEEKREAESRTVIVKENIAMLQAELLEASSLASKRESELCSLHSKVKEMDSLRLQTAVTEEAQRKELEEKVVQLQVQVLEASSLASEREFELSSMQREIKEKDGLRLKLVETQEAHCRELEQKLLEASSLASKRESELCSLHSKVKEMDSLRLQTAVTEEAQRKELEEKVVQLQVQVLEASSLASEREFELSSMQREIKEKDGLRLKLVETQEAHCRELEQKIIKLHEELEHASSLVIQKQQMNETLKGELQECNVCLERNVLRSREEERNRKEMEETIANLKEKLLSVSTQDENAAKLQQQVASLRRTNEELLTIRESSLKEQELSQKLTQDLTTQLQLGREELSTLRPLREELTVRSQLNCDLQEQLSLKSEALEHYKAQLENAKIHYNGKKQKLLEATEKIQAVTTALETSKMEFKTLNGQMKALQLELEQAKAKEKTLLLNVNSLQAQLDYKQLQEQKMLGKCDEMRPKETAFKDTEKMQDTSGDSLELSLDDSLNSTRRPSKREESSTPVVRSSERLQAKRRARGGESLETLYFTPISVRNAVNSKLESSITSLGGLVLDSTKKSSSARRRTTQVINITMTKKSPSRVEADSADGSFYSLQSAQSIPNLASQRGRPFSLDLSEETNTNDQLRHLPGYRRSAVHSAAPTQSISAFRVGAENEPDNVEDWMRIAELQARNQACLPHLKSSYPLESQPNLGIPSFIITDDDLKTGDPNETIRRASMMPSQIRDSLAPHRRSMLPGQIRDRTVSCETMLSGDIGSKAASRHSALHVKRCASNVQSTRAATLPLKRGSCDLQAPDTPEAKKLASCFPRSMTPKDRNDRRFASQNGQNGLPSPSVGHRQSMMFSIENTPKKHGKSNLLQKGINRVRGSTRKSPGSTSKSRSAKSPHMEKPQRRSPRISNKSPKIASSARKLINYGRRMKI